MSSRATLHVLRKNEKPHPAGYNILVEVFTEEEKTDGGLAVQATTEAEQRGACQGIIRELGALAGKDKGDSPEAWGLKVGNTVYFNRYQGDYYVEEGSSKAYILLLDHNVQMYSDPEEK